VWNSQTCQFIWDRGSIKDCMWLQLILQKLFKTLIANQIMMQSWIDMIIWPVLVWNLKIILKFCLAYDLWECFSSVRFTWREVESPTILFGKMVDISQQKIFSLKRISSLVLPSQTQTKNNISLRWKNCCASLCFFFLIFFLSFCNFSM